MCTDTLRITQTLNELSAAIESSIEAPEDNFKEAPQLIGGVDAHGIQILEKAAHRYVEAYDRYPVIAIDHVDPLRCALGDPSSPLLQLGHAYDPSAPSMRPILILNDSQLETLRQGKALLQCTDHHQF